MAKKDGKHVDVLRRTFLVVQRRRPPGTLGGILASLAAASPDYSAVHALPKADLSHHPGERVL